MVGLSSFKVCLAKMAVRIAPSHVCLSGWNLQLPVARPSSFLPGRPRQVTHCCHDVRILVVESVSSDSLAVHGTPQKFQRRKNPLQLPEPSENFDAVPALASDDEESQQGDDIIAQEKMTTAEERVMEPWEQHHAVINMPRYAYNAASILEKGNVGFLITCTFRREKSATKEALTLLREFMNVTPAGNVVTTTTATASIVGDTQFNVEEASQKKVKLSSAGLLRMDEELGATVHGEGDKSSSETAEVAAENGGNADEMKQHGSDKEVVLKRSENGGDGNVDEVVGEDGALSEVQKFMLVKLDTMGVIYISALQESPTSVLTIASRIIKDVQARERAPPQWCHRMLPIQGTCSTKTEEVHALVTRLVREYLDNASFAGDEAINYAVAFNKRGGDSEDKAFDRGECIKIVTAAVNQVTSNVKVDLTSPKMVVVVELIPVAGARSSLICAVSVLPGELVISKPKLTVKPLAPQSKKRKHQ